MDWLSTKIDNLIAWLSAAITSAFNSVVHWAQDFAVWVLGGILSAVASLLSSIPVPSFMSNGLTGLFTALPQPLVYLLDQTGMIAGLAIVGSGVLFNLTRKLLTLGQW